ncbi:MAG: NAD(P)-binding domain-containing protein [Neisseriaceae bacterium]|nr:NAD(P)-binding domain-containing protein [Neisseriaceae bacterium]
MKLGFIGTGVISDAIIRGLSQSAVPITDIMISPRNAVMAAGLAKDVATVTIAADNQQIVDGADMVFIALQTQIAETVVRGLRFRPGQKMVSLMATATADTVRAWTGNVGVVLRAVPLPFVTQHQSMTPIYPQDDDLERLFQALGGVVVAQTEHELNVFMTAGSFMGVYYHFMAECQAWLCGQGLEPEASAVYLAKLFANLAQQTEGGQVDFKALQQAHSTPGGTNELIAHAFSRNGGDQALRQAIDAAFTKMTQPSA